MNRISAQSARAEMAYSLVCELQQHFVSRLNQASRQFGNAQDFVSTEWFRDQGKHGGGIRYMASDETVFNRASVNTSQVQYDDDANKKLASASAISTIIHPQNPLAPSVHIHISWTEMKDHSGYWRVMADLNPANENDADKAQFADTLRQSAPQQYEEAAAQGDHYFYIPALERHRGVTHFYLENFSSGEFSIDLSMAKAVGEAAIDTYCAILCSALETRTHVSEVHRKKQLDYHTLYFFQVLTLDRGTTSGLLVHDQNDVGILASLPAQINRDLLIAWLARMPAPQDQLLTNIISCLPETAICLVDDASKLKLANCLRQHYQAFPQAIDMQARGNSIPPTVNNHR